MENKIANPMEEPRQFENADLILSCHSCGHQDVLQADVSGGIQITLYTTDKHTLSLGCSKCKAVMTLSFREVIKTGVVGTDGEEIVHEEPLEKPENPLSNSDVAETCSPPKTDESDEEPIHEEDTKEVPA